jgi:hypothetical protein
MSDRVIRIAGTPTDVEGINQYLSERLAGQAAAITRQSDERNVAVMTIVVSAAVSGAVKLVFDPLKEYIKERMIKPDARGSKPMLAIQVGDVKITVPSDIKPDQLDRILKSVGE